MRRIWLPLAIAVLLLPLIVWLYSMDEDVIETSLSFAIENGDSLESFCAWSEDGKAYYVFLPAYAGLNDIAIQTYPGKNIYLNGQNLAEGGLDLSEMRLETPYELRYSRFGIRRNATLTFLQSANAAALYIRTASGSMDEIDADKDHREQIEMVLVDADGHRDYVGDAPDEMHGRGNYTWGLDKKSYLLSLHDREEMLGMPAAEKWVLLPNTTDMSNLRNKLIYDFAGRTGLYWTPRCEFTDVYLNGRYHGLYLLTEKIEVSENRLDLNSDALLFSKESVVLAKDEKSYFSLASGVRFEIRNPSQLSEAGVFDLRSRMQGVEDAILSGSDDLFALLDLDSWVRKYLIEEIFKNYDAGLNSQYFYVDAQTSDKVFAGPIWDYDITIGNWQPMIQNPNGFFVMAGKRSNKWLANLYGNEVFHRRLTELYRAEFLPLLMDFDNQIDILAEEMEIPVRNNRIRWAALMAKGKPYREDVQFIRSYMEERIAFLNRAWGDGVHRFYVWPEGAQAPYVYEEGAAADGLPSPEELGLSDSPVWYLAGTDSAFDPAAPVTDDEYLQAKPQSELEREALASQPLWARIIQFPKNHKVAFVYAAGLCVPLLALLGIEWNRNLRRRKAHE